MEAIMKKGLTEIVFILDRSGSMSGLEKDTIGGFNSTIEKQKKETGEAFVSTVLFDDSMDVLHNRIPLANIQPLTDKEYYPRGSTALLDAIGCGIHHIGNVHKYTRNEDRPEKTIFVIITDGYENASRKYTAERVKQMVERQKQKYGWEFIFLGANIDAIETAKRFGICEDRAANFVNDEAGINVMYEAQCSLMSDIRLNRVNERKWKAKVDEDYSRRNNKR
ncbi:MAG: VWA domain-containing protein [Fibrobacter sp.]|nr:VWA domain-containing protein [Fibrobacter sp.]